MTAKEDTERAALGRLLSHAFPLTETERDARTTRALIDEAYARVGLPRNVRGSPARGHATACRRA